MQAYGKLVFSFDNTGVALGKVAAEGFCGIDSFRVFGGKFFIQGKKSNSFFILHNLIRGGFFFKARLKTFVWDGLILIEIILLKFQES